MRGSATSIGNFTKICLNKGMISVCEFARIGYEPSDVSKKAKVRKIDDCQLEPDESEPTDPTQGEIEITFEKLNRYFKCFILLKNNIFLSICHLLTDNCLICQRNKLINLDKDLLFNFMITYSKNCNKTSTVSSDFLDNL